MRLQISKTVKYTYLIEIKGEIEDRELNLTYLLQLIQTFSQKVKIYFLADFFLQPIETN